MSSANHTVQSFHSMALEQSAISCQLEPALNMFYCVFATFLLLNFSIFHHMEPSILVITSIRICIPKRTENISYNWTSDPICTPFASPWCPHFAILTAATPTYSKPMSSLPRRFHRNREVADRKTYNIQLDECRPPFIPQSHHPTKI